MIITSDLNKKDHTKCIIQAGYAVDIHCIRNSGQKIQHQLHVKLSIIKIENKCIEPSFAELNNLFEMVVYFYRAAFFKGQKETAGRKRSLLNLEDDPVYVAVNPDGVYVIDMDDIVS